jgi:large subunit ribosomal protein L5
MADDKKADKSPKAPKGPKPAQGGKAPGGGGRARGAQAAPAEPAVVKRAKVSGEVPPRMRDRFRTAVIPALMKEREYTNPFQVPRLMKVVINMGVGEGKENAKVIDFATADLEAIAGQKPVVTRARKSIANFKLRENAPIGCKVTLRGPRMYEFLDRLVNVALPRRDFRASRPRLRRPRQLQHGPPGADHLSEIVYDKVDKVRAWTSRMVTTAGTDEEAKALLAQLGVPFRVIEMAKTSLILKQQAPKVRRAPTQVQAVWPPARLPAQVQPAGSTSMTRPQGRGPRRDQGERR